MQPIIYNSLDANAPQLTIAAGTLKTILKACLVTGYGSKAGAGWEIAWADDVANKIALRSKNPTSIKSVLFINDNAAASATVTAYNGWDNATNTGTVQFATGYFVKQWTNGFTPNWVVIATDKFFYLFIQSQSDSGDMRVMSGFGDAISLRNDKFFSVCLCQSDTNYSQASVGYSAVATQLGINAKFPNSLYPKPSSYTQWGDTSDASSTSYRSLTAILSPFALYLLIDNLNQPLLQLPGMLMPYSQISGVRLSSDNVEALSNQPPYKNPVLGMYQPWYGRVWIHTDDWGV